MVDYLRPRGQNAPYATIVARTLPCVLDARGRALFLEYSMGMNSEGEVRLQYLSTLLLSADPDDKENACVAIAAAAQDSPTARQACFEQVRQHSIATDGLESPLMPSDGLELFDSNPH